MAHIDNLIESIKDPHLRAALRAEYDKVTKNRRLGLVFDRHMPESVALPGFAIRAGEKVQVLAEGSDDPTELDGTGIWTVASVEGELARLRDGNGETREAPVSRLVATREFGDPIYPGLVSTGAVVRGGGTEGDDGGKPFHTVINAENYHALEALLFAYEGQIDAIYIDPPYNTGARDWKYNNDYVDDADPYRHSKWLSFIERRLLLAKRLLNPADSVLIVTIDEKEYARLALLLEQTFPAARIQMVSAVINPAGVSRPSSFARTDEYVFFVQFGGSRVTPLPLGDEWRLNPDDKRTTRMLWSMLIRTGTNARRVDRPNLFYPIFISEDGTTLAGAGDSVPLTTPREEILAPPGTVAVWPIRRDGTEGNWQISQDRLLAAYSKGYVRLGRFTDRGMSLSYLKAGEQKKVEDGTYEITGHRVDGSVISDTEFRSIIPGTAWRIPSHDSSRNGSNLLRAMMPDRSFPFPKSLYAVEDSLRFFVANKPDAVVLDFFAGSGTTAHAVMRLNKQDGGRRRAILVTNNEVGPDEQATLRARGLKPGDEEWEALGICDYVTKPRIRAAITGTTTTGEPIKGDYRFVDEFPMSEGFAENAEFFTLTYEDPALVSLGRRYGAIAPLLWLRAGAVGERIEKVAEEGWAIPSGAVYGVLFDTTAWGPFVAAAAKREDLTHAFIVTDSVAEYQQIVAKLNPALKTTRLYADYLRSFEINTRR
ncbi:site-specific DNA-methyltransferase [Puerhibacterium puerhi]|uniref:site-specific DNA-methyltransferase n=1 Tax=Puerhibacterium puerhi TaxID=2692623 RepID=UPI001F1C959A|nr:DNA methyltransferase [Puerhibacterium puerhi]